MLSIASSSAFNRYRIPSGGALPVNLFRLNHLAAKVSTLTVFSQISLNFSSKPGRTTRSWNLSCSCATKLASASVELSPKKNNTVNFGKPRWLSCGIWPHVWRMMSRRARFCGALVTQMRSSPRRPSLNPVPTKQITFWRGGQGRDGLLLAERKGKGGVESFLAQAQLTAQMRHSRRGQDRMGPWQIHGLRTEVSRSEAPTWRTLVLDVSGSKTLPRLPTCLALYNRLIGGLPR